MFMVTFAMLEQYRDYSI